MAAPYWVKVLHFQLEAVQLQRKFKVRRPTSLPSKRSTVIR